MLKPRDGLRRELRNLQQARAFNRVSGDDARPARVGNNRYIVPFERRLVGKGQRQVEEVFHRVGP